MKYILYSLLLGVLNSQMLQAQYLHPADPEINKLVSDYHKLFANSKLVVDTIINDGYVKEQGLWQNLLYDQKINKIKGVKSNQVVVSKSSFSDLGLKWVSDATQNFRPGISENEDIFFRSRISTGIDWVVLGEGSWLKGKESYNLYKKQMQKDSLVIQLQNNTVSLQNKLTLLQHFFDLHRLNLLKKYERVLQNQSVYYNHLYNEKLSSYAEKLKADQQLQEINSTIELNETYLQNDFDEALLNKYWKLPFGDADLPALSMIAEENLLKEEERILQLQKEIMINNSKSSDRPSLRAKLRYNYYDTNQSGKSYASVGASLSIPIHIGKETTVVAYELASYENKLQYEKQQLKEKLIAQHREFNTLKKRLLTIENELFYIEALLNNELVVYTDENKNFSPAKYIDYAGQFVQKKLTLLDVKQELCEAYMLFGTLSGLPGDFLTEKVSNIEVKENEQSSYMWKSYFEAHSNEQLISLLKKNKINRLFLSPGSNKVKTEEFIEKAKQQGIHIDRLIGENSFAANADGWVKLIQKLENVKATSFSGIHLDIEPHTFEDYKENREMYIQTMNQIFTKTKQWCDKNNMNLSVSIPLNLPIENGMVLAENKIDAYIMAYETTDQIKLLKRTETLRNTLKTHFIWVLRLSDFKNRKMLNDAEETLKNNGIDKIGYYDFSALTQIVK